MSQRLISVSDSKRLARWGKRDISRECDNPHFWIRSPSTTLPSCLFLVVCFSHLGADLSLDNTPQFQKWVLYSFVFRIQEGSRTHDFYPSMHPQHFSAFLLPIIMLYCNYLCISLSLNNDRKGESCPLFISVVSATGSIVLSTQQVLTKCYLNDCFA